MIIKLDKKDKDAMLFVCAVNDLLCNFFTMETYPLMWQVEITELTGKEIAPQTAFRIARALENKILETID